MRLFFALWPDAPTRSALGAVIATLPLAGARIVPAGELHLTLHFLGDVDAPTAATLRAHAAAIRAAAFDLDIAAAGCWPASRLAWLAPRSVPDGLVDLISGVRLAVRRSGLALAATHYEPHVTAARALPHALGPAPAFSVGWAVREFALMESRTAPPGARYSVLERWPLGAPAGDNTRGSSVQ